MAREMLKSLVGIIAIGGIAVLTIYTYAGSPSTVHVMNNFQIYSNHLYDAIKQNSPFKNITIPNDYKQQNPKKNSSFELRNINLTNRHSEKSNNSARGFSNKSEVSVKDNTPENGSMDKKPLCEKKSKNLGKTLLLYL